MSEEPDEPRRARAATAPVDAEVFRAPPPSLPPLPLPPLFVRPPPLLLFALEPLWPLVLEVE